MWSCVRVCLLPYSRIPKVELVRSSAAEDDVDFEISDDPFAATPLDAKRVPIVVTLCKVSHLALHIAFFCVILSTGVLSPCLFCLVLVSESRLLRVVLVCSARLSLKQIGPQHFIADAAWDEEAASTCRLSVAVDADGATCGTQLTGAGGVAAAKLLDLVEVRFG